MPSELERVAQPRNMPVHQVAGLSRLGFAPDRIDERLPADRAILLQEQDGQNHPLLHRSKINGGIAAPRPERAEHLEP
jgi:hypothetical protein